MNAAEARRLMAAAQEDSFPTQEFENILKTIEHLARRQECVYKYQIQSWGLGLSFEVGTKLLIEALKEKGFSVILHTQAMEPWVRTPWQKNWEYKSSWLEIRW